MIKFAKILPATLLFFKFFRPILSWATQVIHDDQVTLEEVQAGVAMAWPKRDMDGNPLPLQVPWYSKKP